MFDDRIYKIILEITDRLKIINDIFPEGNEHILKHLAASSIHIALFLRDLSEISFDKKENYDKHKEDKFLEYCGCNFK